MVLLRGGVKLIQDPLQKGMRMAQSLETVMSIGELSRYLKISRSTLYKLAQEGKLPGQKVGRHWRFHRDAVDGWLGKVAASPTAQTGGSEK